MSIIKRDTENTLQVSNNGFTTMAGDNGLPETYHLEGGNNFGVWAYGAIHDWGTTFGTKDLRNRNIWARLGYFFYYRKSVYCTARGTTTSIL
jgi:hypothetical protein